MGSLTTDLRVGTLISTGEVIKLRLDGSRGVWSHENHYTLEKLRVGR